jgi:hypothetical protein
LNRRKKLVLSLGSAAFLLGVIGTVVVFEPRAPRYRGHTVNQWLDALAAKGRGGPDAGIVNGFGTNALSTLMQATKGPFWMNTHLVQAIDQSDESNFLKRYGHKTLTRARRRTKLAYEWTVQELLISTDRHIPQYLLGNNPDDQFVIRMFRYAQNTDAPTSDILELYAINAPDTRLRERARRLFKEYKKWDDKTYKKWLSDHPESIQPVPQYQRFKLLTIEQADIFDQSQKPQ